MAMVSNAANYDNFFAGACKRCKKAGGVVAGPMGPVAATEKTELQRCSRCKHVWYCSRECQKADFAEHKQVCKAMAQVATILDAHQDDESELVLDEAAVEPYVFPAGREAAWWRRRMRHAQLTKQFMQMKGLDVANWDKDQQIMLLARRCAGCHAHDVELTACSTCHCVFYCSDECREARPHDAQCDMLLLALHCQQFLSDSTRPDFPSVPAIIPDQLVDEGSYSALGGEDAWATYMARRQAGHSDGRPFQFTQLDPLVLVTVSDQYLTFPLTILHSLEQLLGTEALRAKSRLQVHKDPCC